MNNEEMTPESLLASQMAILGFDNSPAPLTENAAAEAASWRMIELKPLDLGKVLPVALHRRTIRPKLTSSAVAAVLVLVGAFLHYQSASDLASPGGRSAVDANGTDRIKGGDSVEIFVDQGGVVSAWNSGTPAPNGARFRVRIVAARDLDGFQMILGRNGRWLTPASEVFERRLKIEAIKDITFPDTYQLIGTNEGETIGALLCRPQMIQTKEQLAAAVQAAAASIDASPQGKLDVGPCRIFWSHLR